MTRGVYVVAGQKPWNRTVFEEELASAPGRWHFLADQTELTEAHLAQLDPEFVFFLHWSRIVPAAIFERWTCVVFHMTDVPYGRGGSPLQNLIVRGHRTTKLSAIRMRAGVDAGPVYLKEDLSLEGGAEEIFIRASRQAARMILRILAERPEPQPQSGEPTVFRRRAPVESEIPSLTSLDELFDFLRMLDADGYPRAFIQRDGFRYEFSRPARYHGRVVADVTITEAEGERG